MVVKMILNNESTSIEIDKNFEVKTQHSIVQALHKWRRNASTPTQEIFKRKEMGSGSGLCWSCRKMGYTTDICSRRSDKIKKFSQKKRHRSEITHTKRIGKIVLRSCWTCRKKSYTAVCSECQQNIITTQRNIITTQSFICNGEGDRCPVYGIVLSN